MNIYPRNNHFIYINHHLGLLKIFTQNWQNWTRETASINAEQILLDDQSALNWYD